MLIEASAQSNSEVIGSASLLKSRKGDEISSIFICKCILKNNNVNVNDYITCLGKYRIYINQSLPIGAFQ
jgi:hypothetical protein